MGCLLKDELKQKCKDEGSQSFSEKEDILTAVLGPEHYGWVRAKGEGVTPYYVLQCAKEEHNKRCDDQ